MKKTIAEEISALMGDDYETWETPDGESLQDVCMGKCVKWTRDDTPHDTQTSYEFSDGSIISIVNDSWDVGFHHCWCFRGAGHADDCDSSECGLRARTARKGTKCRQKT